MENKIPHVIHYFWFGKGSKTPLAEKCISSWRKYLPDYEIKEWNESNFNVNLNTYTKQAYESAKYAFVSDVARLWVLYNYGGVYLDIDVELIQNPSLIIEKGPFLGTEKSIYDNNTLFLAVGSLFGVEKGNKVIQEVLSTYDNDEFWKNGKQNLRTINHRITDIFLSKGWNRLDINQEFMGLQLYSSLYFSPLDWKTTKLRVSKNTYCIHWFSGSWFDSNLFSNLKKIILRLVPDFFLIKYFRLKNNK